MSSVLFIIQIHLSSSAFNMINIERTLHKMQLF